MRKIKKLNMLFLSAYLIFLISTNINCNLSESGKTEKEIKEKLLRKHKIKKEWIELELIREFPTPEDEKKGHYFYSPSDMIMDSEQFIYVVDSGLHKVLKFTKDGEYVGEFGRIGEGPGEFYFPNTIRFYKGLLFIYDGRGRIQITDPSGKYLREFKSFYIIHDFIISKNGYIYANCTYGKAKKENPLIVRFNTKGKIIDSFGDRIDIEGHWTSDSEVFLAQLRDEIIAAFVHYPIVRRYTLNGEFIKEFRLNLDILNKLEKYNYKKWFTNPEPYKLVLPRLIAGIRILSERIFILLQLPRIEILEIDKMGNILNYYYSTKVKNAVTFWGFLVREEKNNLFFYILQAYPEDKLYVFQPKLKNKSHYKKLKGGKNHDQKEKHSFLDVVNFSNPISFEFIDRRFRM